MAAFNQNMIAQIGLGYWGKNILRNLNELKVLQLACDKNIEQIEQCRHCYPDLIYTPSIKDILFNRRIKAVAIVTPALTHYQLIRDCLLAGKDVFVEKPLALTFKQGKELVNLAVQENKILMVGHILQYHPAILKLKQLILENELGDIQYIYSNRLNIGPFNAEESILWDLASHDVSIILMLLEKKPCTVSAFGAYYLNRGIYDTALITLDFVHNVKSHIFVSRLHPFKEQTLVVLGSKKMAVFDDMSVEKLFLYPHQITWQTGNMPVVRKADGEIVRVEKSEPLKFELLHFINCVKNRETPKTDGLEGLRVLEILEKAEKSLLSQQYNKIANHQTGFFSNNRT